MQNSNDLKNKYDQQRGLYDRLGSNLVDSIKQLAKNANIPLLDVVSRSKTWESVCEKIERKGYSDPFKEIEDWCGIRIICYYPSDVSKISEIIAKEFSVSSQEDTAQRLKPQEFGYRSLHFIVALKPEWMHVPMNRELNGLKAEIQVRTILMHAWAEIEHRLAYKSNDQVPAQFQRQLFRLSAKFEEADEQFEQLKTALGEYRTNIDLVVAKNDLKAFDMDLDVFINFLNNSYPHRKSSEGQAATLLKELKGLEIDLSDMQKAVALQKPNIEVFENICGGSWAQVGAMRNALDVYNDAYYKFRLGMMKVKTWHENVNECRKIAASQKRKN